MRLRLCSNFFSFSLSHLFFLICQEKRALRCAWQGIRPGPNAFFFFSALGPKEEGKARENQRWIR